MDVELRLLDQIKLTNHLTRNFASEYSQDDHFFIITETGLYILRLKCNLSSTFTEFTCSKSFFQVSKYIPAANVDLDINTFHKDLDRKALYESVLAAEYSSSLRHMKPLEPCPLSAAWSPAGIVGKTSCLLGVMTNVHSLEIYYKDFTSVELVNYIMVCNITEKIIAVQRNKWKDATRFSIPIKLEEFKNRVNSVSVSAFTWSHIFEMNGKNQCVVIVGLLNGDLTLWRVQELTVILKKKLKVHFMGRFSTQLKRISALHWHQTSEYGGGLSFGDVSGRVNILRITDLNQELAIIDLEYGLWTKGDKVLVDKITIVTHEERSYIVIIKQNVLVIFGINKEGVVFDKRVEYVEEYYITGVYTYKNVVICLSLTGTLTQFTISGKRADIVVTRKKIHIRADIQQYRTHGLFFSPNMIMCGILLFPKSLHQFSTLRTNFIVNIFNNSYLNPVEILWKNPTGSLRGYWDCFEILRLICLKEKRFPWMGMPTDLNHDTLSLLQLKTLRLIAQLSETTFIIVPRIHHYNIKPFILLHYLLEIKLIVARMKKLFGLKSSGKELSVFQMRSLDIQNFFLKEMIGKNVLPKMNVGKKIVNEVREVMAIANELEYPDMMQCVWCGEKLIGSSCLPPHEDSRCCFTMMPIFLVPGHKCPTCQCVAHREAGEEISLFICPYCDIPMDYIPVDSKKVETLAKQYNIDTEGVVKSVCFNDCLSKEALEIQFEDIEENETEFVIFSDSDDEDDDDLKDKLKILYFRMGQCNLGELMTWEGRSTGQKEGEPNLKQAKLEVSDEDNDSSSENNVLY